MEPERTSDRVESGRPLLGGKEKDEEEDGGGGKAASLNELCYSFTLVTFDLLQDLDDVGEV